MIAVTGSDGFAGSHLVDLLLSQGLKVKALVRSTPLNNLTPHDKLEVCAGDLLDVASLLECFEGCDQVYHLGAVSGIDESRVMQEQCWNVNTLGTFNVVRACIAEDVKRLLFASTCHVKGSDIYAVSKRAGEEICSTFKTPEIVITRAYNHYGPRQRDS